MTVTRKTFTGAEIMRLCTEVDAHALSGFIDEATVEKIHAATAILRHVVRETGLKEITVKNYVIRLRPSK